MSKNMKSLVKTLHLLSACLWLGAATSTVLLQCLQGWSQDGRVLVALNRNLFILDFGLIIPGAMGSALTGFIMCKKTNWGFTRYRWVMTKGLLTITAILIGTFCLGPWQLKMVELSGQADNALSLSATYAPIRSAFTWVGFLQVLLLAFILAVSVIKPWGRRASSRNEARMRQHKAQAVA